MSFPVTLSKAGRQSVTVSWSTADGTAPAPGDYAAGNGTLTFAPGETSKAIASRWSATSRSSRTRR